MAFQWVVVLNTLVESRKKNIAKDVNIVRIQRTELKCFVKNTKDFRVYGKHPNASVM